MAFEDLREKVGESFKQISDRIQESDSFQQLKERYDSLSPSAQKIIKILSLSLVILVLVSIPYSIYTSSSESEETFVYYRDMTRKLLKTETEAANIGRVGLAYDEARLSSRARSAIMTTRLQPSQIKSIVPFISSTAKKIKGIPKTVERAGVKVSLSNLNFKQLLKVSNQLESIDPSVKIWDLSIQATPQNPLYYDVTYSLVSFFMKEVKKPQPKRKRGRTRGKRSSSKGK